MSRVAKAPIIVPGNVQVVVAGQAVTVKGPNGELSISINSLVTPAFEGNVLSVRDRKSVV